jgi:uncharacterized oxidoreductase
MKLTKNTALITGGSSGIGLEIARTLVLSDNKVIICGRSREKLEAAKKLYPELITYQCDISDLEECTRMSHWLHEMYPETNILINNAAIVHKTSFRDDENIISMAQQETSTNFLAAVYLSKLILPIIEKNPDPSIIFISTGLVYAPRAVYPIYNATKAAMHSFAQTIRIQLSDTPVRVYEIMMPAVDTPFHNGDVPKIAISTEAAVKEMFQKLGKDEEEIKIAGANLLYRMSRIAPAFALKKINSIQ